mgnify:CR=1 FL=1
MKFDSGSMREGPILKSVIIYTIPIILTGLLQLLFNAADLIVVGWFSGSDSVAAVGATGALTNLIVNLFIGLSVGAGVAVAQGLGAGNDKITSDAVHTAIPVAVISGIFLTVIGVLFSRNFLELMGTPEGKLLSLSSVYMQIYFCGMTFSMLYNFGSAILRAAGDTRSPLIFLTIAGVLNVILNIVFVALFKLDVAGVALATSISQAVSAVLVLRALIKRQDACRFEFKKMYIHKSALLRMARIGVPAGLQGSLFSISNVLIQSSVNSFGAAHMSGSAAASSIEGFCYVTMNSFHQTALNFCGQNYGAGDFKRVKRITWVCLMTVAAAGFIVGNLSYIFGRELLGIYITDSPEAINYGMERLKFMLIPYFLCGIMDTTTGAMRGIGSSVIPMIITVVGVCVMRIVWIYTVFAMPQYHTFSGLFISYPISWLLTFAALFISFITVMRHKEKKINALKGAAL